MGTVTPNIGIYIAAAGESNYANASAAGMINIDQHDHSGGPNKGLPISSSGLGNFSVTFEKLDSNVADTTTGIGTNSTPPFQNQLQILGILRNLFQLATTTGFLAKNGSNIAALTFQNSATISWTNPDGSGGNPSASVIPSGLGVITVPNGGTGVSTLSPYDIILGGTTPTGNVQQVVGEGTLNQYLGSNGPLAPPDWKTLPTPAAQNYKIATLSLTAAQFDAITSSGATNVIIVPAQGAGTVIVVDSIWGKVTYGGVDPFHGGSAVHLYWGTSSIDVGFVFTSGSFKDSYTGYYYADDQQTSSSTGIPKTTIENKNVTIGINSSSFTGGTGNTVSFSCQYSVMQI